MPMIGASLEDLSDVSTRYGSAAGVVRDSGSTVVSTVNGAVGALQAETTSAQTTCINSIEAMKSEMTLTLATLQGAEYVGQNADTARQAGTELDQRCAKAVADMTEAFDQFRTQITSLGENLTGIAQGYDAYAAQTAESGEGMSKAVAQQRENLDAAMSGMNYA